VEPSYSRTGKIAFSGERNGQYDIWVMNGDGSNLHPITHSAADDLEPAWSPNGKRIAFSSTRSGHGDIYTMSPTGKNLTRITSSGGIDKQPNWSPSGKSIVFSSLREQNPKIYVTPARKGGHEHRITSGPGPDTDPAWSPDGKHIVYAHGQGGHKGRGFDLFITTPRGGKPHRITDDVKSYEIKPDWARK
jgi:TolB protein